MYQLTLQFQNSKDTLRDSLEKLSRRPVVLSITDNASSLLSIRIKHDFVFARMHWMFLKAGDDILKEIADFISKRTVRTPLIRHFIQANSDCIKARDGCPKRPVAIRTKGKFHDLREVFTSLNDTYFSGQVTSSISWGRRHARRIVRRLTLGSFSKNTNTIWINTVLDRKTIPGYFIRYIVYHEMLHSIMKEEKKNGRRLLHNSAFRQRERLLGEYEKAVAWEKKYFTGNSKEAYSKE